MDSQSGMDPHVVQRNGQSPPVVHCPHLLVKAPGSSQPRASCSPTFMGIQVNAMGVSQSLKQPSGNARGVEGYTLQLPQPSREGKSNASSVLSPRFSNPNRTEPQLHTSGILPWGKPLAPGSLPHFSCWSILGNSPKLTTHTQSLVSGSVCKGRCHLSHAQWASEPMDLCSERCLGGRSKFRSYLDLGDPGSQ